MDLNGSCSSLDMDCLSVCPDYFLYYNLPKKTFPKTYIPLLIWTIFWHFFDDEFDFRQRRRGADDRRIKTNNKCQIFYSKIKSWITSLGIVFKKNDKCKCDSELNIEEVLLQRFRLAINYKSSYCPGWTQFEQIWTIFQVGLAVLTLAL